MKSYHISKKRGEKEAKLGLPTSFTLGDLSIARVEYDIYVPYGAVRSKLFIPLENSHAIAWRANDDVVAIFGNQFVTFMSNVESDTPCENECKNIRDKSGLFLIPPAVAEQLNDNSTVARIGFEQNINKFDADYLKPAFQMKNSNLQAPVDLHFCGWVGAHEKTAIPYEAVIALSARVAQIEAKAYTEGEIQKTVAKLCKLDTDISALSTERTALKEKLTTLKNRNKTLKESM